ncbi:MAG: CoA transferase, partial [Saprospiraceae bacterium]
DTARGDNNDILSGEMAKWCQIKTTAEALVTLKEAKLPAGPVLSFQGALDNPMVQSINHLNPLPYPGAFKDPLVTNAPFKLSKTPLEKLRRAPLLGEHNAEIYSGLGYSDKAIAEFKATKII